MAFMNTVNAILSAVRSASHRRLGQAGGILWLLALMVPAAAARLVALPAVPGHDFAYLHHSEAVLGQVAADGTLRLQPWPRAATAAAARDGRAIIFSGHQAQVVPTDADAGETWMIAEEVRDAVVVGDRIALLVGGAFQQGVLRGARVLLWPGLRPPAYPAPPVPAPQVNSAWDPFLLRAAPGRPELLVGMRKTAHFDPVERARPFLYRLVADTLRPIWKGTAFSHPFVDAALVPWPTEPHVVTCALEELGGEMRAVLMYTWTGAAMEAVARSAPGRLGNVLQATGPGEVGVFETDERGWRLIVLAPGNKNEARDVRLLQPIAEGPWLARRPAAWTLVSHAGARWLVYAGPDSELHAVQLHNCTSGLSD
jgi:hypothetical protein